MTGVRPTSVSSRRRRWGYGVAVLLPLLVLPVLVPLRDHLNLASDVAVYLVLVVVASLVGGLGPALLSVAISAGLLNFFFTRPYQTLDVDSPDNVVALAAFGAVAVMVSWLVDVAEQRAAAAAAAVELEAVDRLRASLLTAVGHDLRSPLAAAKAAVSGLRSADVTLGDSDREELLEAADGELDRLAGLVDNLLDMSRLQAGVLPVHLRPTDLDDVVARALDSLGVAPRGVVLDVDADLPPVVADAGLLERAVANLVANAQRFAPAGRPALLAAVLADGEVRLRVVDAGPGIPAADRERMFQPFQRAGDTDAASGLGLGLALARGLVEAMGGTLTPYDTDGGGLTMEIRLAVAGAA